MNLKVNLGKESYNINFYEQMKNIDLDILNIDKYNKKVVITDENVFDLYSDKMNFTSNIIKIKAGESNKNINTVVKIVDELSAMGIGRKDLIIAIGGGVVGDIAGFVSAIYMRGVDFVQVPTTLLAMVDSSVGGKNGVDTEFGKNLIGTFKQPKQVLIYTDFLKTLSFDEMKNGFAEIIKHSLIKDKNMFEYLANNDIDDIMENIRKLIYDNVKIKACVVEQDEKEQGERMKLNFGHTLGHALEQHTNFETYSHGEAVAIGMYKICEIAYKKCVVQNDNCDKIASVLNKFGLPYKYDKVDDLIKYIKNDKKSEDDKVNFILVDEIGEAKIYKTNTSFASEV